MSEYKNISMKARVAYGICCLEKALIYYKCTVEKWQWILEKMWKYTDIEFLDDWYYEMAEYLPDSLMDDMNYKVEAFEYLSKEQFNNLSKLYRKEANTIICEIFRLVFEIGTIDLYSKLEGGSENTISRLENIENIMKDNQIERPELATFMQYCFEDNNGWGKDFVGRNISLILR